MWMEARSKLRPKLGGRTQPCGEHALRLLYADLHLLLHNTHPGVSGTGQTSLSGSITISEWFQVQRGDKSLPCVDH